ncbi:type II secretion system F family protein [Rhodoluna sp.]|uniref:type II secretion system F family protein n=1 Tax=Rhodoluna sp. TaxID=1969481 RepID=UPI0025F6FF5D|nr:type II secretion system F family protein [Rhodoluna sp.]
MNWLRSSVEGAGFAKYGAPSVVFVILFSALIVGVWVHSAFGVLALAIFVAIGAVGLGFEMLLTKARNRRAELVKVWPEVVDSIHSAITSGLSLAEALAEVAHSGPTKLRLAFANSSARLDAGVQMVDSLDLLKADLGEVHADRLCEILRLSATGGGESLARALREQSKQLRSDVALWGELASKQGWVAGTAKLAVAAPWIVVAMLSIRSENAAIYNSTVGVAILMVGFVVSVFAYRLIHFLGTLPEQPRVFAS